MGALITAKSTSRKRHRHKLKKYSDEISKNIQNIPAPELDSIPNSSSPNSSFPEAGSIPEESSPEADSIPDKLGKMRLRVTINHQYSKAMTKTKTA